MTRAKKIVIYAVFSLIQNVQASTTSELPAGRKGAAATEITPQVAFGEKSGTIEYDITDSAHRKVGLTKVINEFEFNGNHYRFISTFMSASGKSQFVSEGKIERNRLVPRTFSRNVAGHQDFKIDVGSEAVVITKSSGASESLPGSLAPIDIISTLYQAASITKETDAMLLTQVNIYGTENTNMSYVGEETLDTRLGSQRVVHVRSKTSATVQDIWIAPAQYSLPVKFTIPAQGTSLIASVSKLKFK